MKRSSSETAAERAGAVSLPPLPKPEEVAAVVPAAGRGSRLPGAVEKQFRELAGRPLFHHALSRVAREGLVGRVVLAVPPGSGTPPLPEGLNAEVEVVEGGARRQDSVASGLAAAGGAAWVIVHDAARPLLPRGLMARCLRGAAGTGASAAALRVVDAVKAGGADGCVERTLPREGLWLAQTPQVARRELLERALAAAGDAGFEGPDEAALLEAIGVRVRLVEGCARNLKVTAPGDVERAARLMALEKEGEGERPEGETPLFRVGVGCDVHRFQAGRRLVLGGVEIPHERGLAGHSDADVLTHAICDALLGAAALGDIGRHFPDSDEAYRDADSRELLARVAALLGEAGMAPWNVDAVVVAERPRLAPYVPAMREALSAALGVSPDAVGVKATTSEGLGFAGREEGIAAQAVCAIRAASP